MKLKSLTEDKSKKIISYSRGRCTVVIPTQDYKFEKALNKSYLSYGKGEVKTGFQYNFSDQPTWEAGMEILFKLGYKK